jgi:hypothetical protein
MYRSDLDRAIKLSKVSCWANEISRLNRKQIQAKTNLNFKIVGVRS